MLFSLDGSYNTKSFWLPWFSCVHNHWHGNFCFGSSNQQMGVVDLLVFFLVVMVILIIVALITTSKDW